MRAPGLFNWALALGLVLGPAIGAFAGALIFGIANASMEYFGYFLAVAGAFGYMFGLPAFSAAMLLLRHFRVDWLWLCALVGLGIGIFGFVAGLGQQVTTTGQLQLATEASLPFALMMVAIRLIAGPRT
jgi:uncharacterized membrane protein YfcA